MINTSTKCTIHQLSRIALTGMLSLALHSCGESDTAQISASTPSVSQVVEPAAKPFNKPPMLLAQPQASLIPSAASSFIRTTDGDQRAKQVQKGRQDPFAGVFVQAAPSVVTTVVPQTSQPLTPRIAPKPPRVSVRLSSPSPRVNIIPPSNSSTIQSIPLPPVAASSPETVLPSLPQDPTLAKAVAVSGVIQVGEESEAIVKVPNELTSRYVKVGQRLANGQVLVKRIEVNAGSDPVVILEQFGIEVVRAVGQQPETQTPTNTPPAETQAPTSTPPAETQTPTNTPPVETQAPTNTPLNSTPAPPPPPTNSSSPEAS